MVEGGDTGASHVKSSQSLKEVVLLDEESLERLTEFVGPEPKILATTPTEVSTNCESLTEQGNACGLESLRWKDCIGKRERHGEVLFDDCTNSTPFLIYKKLFIALSMIRSLVEVSACYLNGAN